jgi:zinc and cadmium transporter
LHWQWKGEGLKNLRHLSTFFRSPSPDIDHSSKTNSNSPFVETAFLFSPSARLMPDPHILRSIYAMTSVALVTAAALGGTITFTLGDRVTRALPYLVSLAAGALLGTATSHLLPEAIQRLGTGPLLTIPMLAGFVGFFLFEKLFSLISIWVPQGVEGPRATLVLNILSGGAIHSFIDGMAVATAYLADLKLGIFTTGAVLLHEVPHHIGNMCVLLNCGVHRRSATVMNVVAAGASLVGALFVLLIGSKADSFASILVPFTAANFIYIATADLMPELQADRDLLRSVGQITFLVLGALMMVTLRNI